MEENIKNPETEGTKETTGGAEQKPAEKTEGEKTTMKEKKENWFKRTGKKIKKAMSDHPFWTAFGGAALGSAATVGVAEVGKRVINSRNERNVSYVQEDPNSLDPNL